MGRDLSTEPVLEAAPAVGRGTEPDVDELGGLLCSCAACLLRANLAKGVEELRYTAMFHRRQEKPWTVFISRDGVLCCAAHGETEDEALYEALKVMGVIR